MKTEIIVFLVLLVWWVSCFALYHIVNYLWSRKSKPFEYVIRFGNVFFNGSEIHSGRILKIKSKDIRKANIYPTSEQVTLEQEIFRHKAYIKEEYIGIYDTEIEAVTAIYENSKKYEK
jgi:hypothetical protein